MFEPNEMHLYQTFLGSPEALNGDATLDWHNITEKAMKSYANAITQLKAEDTDGADEQEQIIKRDNSLNLRIGARYFSHCPQQAQPDLNDERTRLKSLLHATLIGHAIASTIILLNDQEKFDRSVKRALKEGAKETTPSAGLTPQRSFNPCKRNATADTNSLQLMESKLTQLSALQRAVNFNNHFDESKRAPLDSAAFAQCVCEFSRPDYKLQRIVAFVQDDLELALNPQRRSAFVHGQHMLQSAPHYC